jgi:exopolysaccharide biosynthesis polyprenyl glycosylphosphotransferase
MYTRKTLLMLSLAEGAVLWLAVVFGIALANEAQATTGAALGLQLGRAALFSATCVVSLYFADLYDIVTLRRPMAFPERLPYALAVALFMLAVLYVLFPSARLNAVILVPSAAASVVFLFAMRTVLGRYVRRRAPERVLVLGDAKLGHRIAAAVDAKSHGEHVVVGVLALEANGANIARELDSAMRSTHPDRIVVATADPDIPLPLQQLLQGRLHGIAVEDWVPFYERLAGKIALDALSPGSVAFGAGFGEARLHAAFARAMGLVAALVGLFCLAPFLLLVCIAIRVTSAGPVFFIHQRIGRQGRPYGLIKLRTMYMATKPHSEWALDNHDRITPIGRWLRRYRIDELPQLINVLKGDMNLVGPRPHPVSNYLMFMERIPHYAFRSVVRPGITGWAQVRYGYANNLEQEIEKMRFDLFYIRNVSIWLDLRVLFETVRVVARGHESDPAGDKALPGQRYGTMS